MLMRRATGRRHLSEPYKIQSSMFPRLASRLLRSLFGLLWASWLLIGNAFAGDLGEFWYEVGAFVTLSPQTRLFIDLPSSKGMDSDTRTHEFAAYVDVSIMPILRPSLQQKDWAGNRYLWARIGYDHVINTSNGVRDVPEDRGILELRGRVELPARLWLEGRTRADLRWIDGDYSTRYRFRLEVSHEFTILGHAVTPYCNVEWFYDTRYSGWARTHYQTGPEITVNGHFRVEVYYARQVNHFPSSSTLNALGVFLKWFY
jgi:hypothetical protein